MPGVFSFISEQRSKQEVVTEALHVLAKIHGGKIELPVKAFVSRWGKDPFARGSYSYLPPGTTGTQAADEETKKKERKKQKKRETKKKERKKVMLMGG